MNCTHTGLPTYCCGHCNGTHAVEVEPFRGLRPDNEPRFVKGRDKAAWQGIGRNMPMPGTYQVRVAAMMSNPRTKGLSAWRLENAERTVKDLKVPASFVLNPLCLLPRPVEVVTQFRNVDGVRNTLPHKTSDAVPRRFEFEKMRHARNQGAACRKRFGVR